MDDQFRGNRGKAAGAGAVGSPLPGGRKPLGAAADEGETEERVPPSAFGADARAWMIQARSTTGRHLYDGQPRR